MRLVANGTPGDTVKTVVRRSSDGYIWNGSTVVAFDGDDIHDYQLATTDPDSIGEFGFTTPAGLPEGSYYAAWISIAGGDLELTDFPAFASKNFTIGETAEEADSETGDAQATYEAQLIKIDTAINNLLANPRPNYQVNGVRMDYGALLSTLMNAREQILKRLNSLPAEEWDAVDTEISVFGQDLGQYLGDPS